MTASTASKPHRFESYAAYRPSGIEWLGEIPEHWEVKPLKRTFAILNGSTPKSGEPDYWDGDIAWATPDDLGSLAADTINATKRMITQEGYRSCGTTIAPAGSLVLSTRAPIGHLAIAGIPLCTNQGCRCLVFREETQSHFHYYQLLSARNELESWGQGSTFKELGRDRLAAVHLASVPKDEQRAIAAFLDRETARIDALIEKKQRQIELLREKRAAAISHAVTKGLDPDAKMRDSGTDWLDKHPAHWTGLPLKRWVSTKITDGPHETPELVDEGVDFVSAEAVQNGRINFEARRGYITEDLHNEYCRKCMPERDDVFLVKSGATTGKLAYIDTDREFSVWSPLALVRADSQNVLPSFLFSALGSDYVQCQIQRTWSAGTQPNISMGALERLFVVVPPLDEQQQIMSHLDTALSSFGRLTERINASINLLREYRTAIISAAVTGKIDVREVLV